MVASGIEIVTGYLIPTFDKLLPLLMKSNYFTKFIEEHGQDYDLDLNSIQDPDIEMDFFYDMELDNIEINGMNVFTWTCCSPLAYKQFIIGKSTGFFLMEDLNEKMTILSSIPKINIDTELEEFEIVTVILPNDCMSCS